MPNRLSNEDWNALVEHLREQIVREGRSKPDFMRAQRATGIDRRTVKAHWEGSVQGHPCLERFFKREDQRPAPTRPAASPKPVAVVTPAATPTGAPGVAAPPASDLAAPAVPAARVQAGLASGPLGPAEMGPATQPASALAPPVDPFERVRAAAIAVLKDEQMIVEGQHTIGKGLLDVTISVLQALYESIPAICLQVKTRLGENPKEGIALLRELMEISEKLSKTHGRNVETQRLIAGVPTSHTELTVRREGPTGNPDSDDERIEQSRQLKSLIKAEARRLVRVEDYAAEAGEFIEVEATPVRQGEASVPDPMPVAEPAVPMPAVAEPGAAALAG